MKRLWVCFLLAVMLAAVGTAGEAVVVLGGTGVKDDLAERAAAAKSQMQRLAVGRYGMTPIRPQDVAPGAYSASVESSSPFFKVVDAALSVDGDGMSLTITVGSDSYLYVYPGTAREAESAGESAWIPGELSEGRTSFTLPVSALNAAFDCAAYSRARQRWYDRQLLVDAASLPEGALDFALPDYEVLERALSRLDGGGEVAQAAVQAPEAAQTQWADGEYSIEVNLAGGSGRAAVSSPTLLTVRDGRAYATLLWSSPYYDYMLLGGARFDNLTTDGGNSTFQIPVTALDAPMAVVADTTAMGDPVEIDYTLTFYSESLGDRGQIPQEAAKKVLLISLAIIVLGGALNWYVKRRRRGR